MKYREPLQMEVTPETTVLQARAWLSDASRTREGALCPLTGRFTKVENRRLNASMVAALRWMVEHSAPGEYIHMPKKAPKKFTATNQHSTLQHWGLVESMPNTNPHQKCSGMWRATEKGRKFNAGLVSVPSRAIINLGRCEKLTGDEVFASEVFKGFDYQEFLNTAADDHG